MIIQLHLQHRDGNTDMRAQRDVVSNDDMSKFVKETLERHPCPDDTIWMACNEKSPHFVTMPACDIGIKNGIFH